MCEVGCWVEWNGVWWEVELSGVLGRMLGLMEWGLVECGAEWCVG